MKYLVGEKVIDGKYEGYVVEQYQNDDYVSYLVGYSDRPNRIVGEEYLKPFNKHEHQYVIPVEWEYGGNQGVDYDTGESWEVIKAKRVTKLRCSCGDEVER